MTERSILRKRGQVTIPREVRKAAHLDPGDPVDITYADGVITIRPMKAVDTSQAWFWTPEWQEGEHEASEDIAAGRTTVYKTDEDFLDSLR